MKGPKQLEHNDPTQRPHTYTTAGDGHCALCGHAEDMGMWHAPHASPIVHVYIPEKGTDRCMCGQPRYTGLHTAYDGTPEPDLTGITEAVQHIQEQLNAIRRILKGRP